MTFVLVSIVSVSVVLGILVLVHEFGHFIVAKLCGVRVETFSIGFGTRLFGFEHGGTDYCVRLLPLGGYVKMAGEALPGETSTDTSAETKPSSPGDYQNHPRWQRILIACAGPAANFLLALVFMTAIYAGFHEVPNYLDATAVTDYVQPGSAAAKAGLQSGDRIVRFDGVENPTWQEIFVHSVLNLNHSVALQVEHSGQMKDLSLFLKSPADPDNFDIQDVGITPVEQKSPLKVAMLEPGMPGEKAGLKVGDEIESVDGIALHSVKSMVLYLQHNGDKPVMLGILRDAKPMTLSVTPAKGLGADGNPTYQVGFAATPPPSHAERLSLPQAFSQSVRNNVKGSTLVIDVLRRIATNRMSVRTLSGPVGIARATGNIVSLPGWTPVITWTANLSLQLGLLNLLPIPILDGGVILFLVIESIMQRDLNERFKERIYQTAFIFLVLLMVFIVFSDLAKIPAIARLKL